MSNYWGEPWHLPFTEAPHRNYGDARALFGPINADDRVIRPLTDVLAHLIAAKLPDLVLAPAAIGNHVDHLIVRRVVEVIYPTCVFWADMPYAMRTGFEQTGFIPFFCGAYSKRKMDASLSYESQIEFQFGGGINAPAGLTVEDAEWFQGPSESLATLRRTAK